jgi:hypothetical protein
MAQTRLTFRNLTLDHCRLAAHNHDGSTRIDVDLPPGQTEFTDYGLFRSGASRWDINAFVTGWYSDGDNRRDSFIQFWINNPYADTPMTQLLFGRWGSDTTSIFRCAPGEGVRYDDKSGIAIAITRRLDDSDGNKVWQVTVGRPNTLNSEGGES